MNIFKRILNFFSPNKEIKAHRAEPLHEPHADLSSVRKNETINPPQEGIKEILKSIKKKERIFRIFPNFFSKPQRPVFKKPQARKRSQQIYIWDDKYFPERWRHKLIRH